MVPGERLEFCVIAGVLYQMNRRLATFTASPHQFRRAREYLSQGMGVVELRRTTTSQQRASIYHRSMNQFVTLAIAEKIPSLNALDYLEKRARRGSREKLLAVLAKAPDTEPEETVASTTEANICLNSTWVI